MSRKARCQHLLEKSVHAALSAIEIYNKPDFKYGEESFSILVVNAWELLLKARILQLNKNKLESIYLAYWRSIAPLNDGSWPPTEDIKNFLWSAYKR